MQWSAPASGAACGQRPFSVQEGNVRDRLKMATFPRIGLPQARPLMVWFTTAWKIEAARSSLVAPSLIRGCISDLAKYAAAGCDGIDSLDNLWRIRIQSGGIRL